MALRYTRGLLYSLFLALPLLAEADIAPRMQEALLSAAADGSLVKAYVVLQDQVDVVALNEQLNAERASLKERAYRVITTLQNKAGNSQEDILAALQYYPAAEVATVTPMWITNMLLVEAQAQVFYDLSARADVWQMDVVAPPYFDKPVDEGPAPASIPNGVEPGVRAINAHLLWALGINGSGRLVMGIDSGVNGNHPAITGRWRGNTAPADQAWLGSGSFPNDCDSGTHGTHTLGTMLGLDPATNDTLGVAPGAEWIASGALCGNVTRAQAFQWALDPDNDPNTISDMPDAICNSWWDPNGGTCSGNIYFNVINALEAAGIAVVFSAGNDGPGISTITQPKNTNTTLTNFWATGAVNGNVPDYPIAGFSSRGPSTCGLTGSLLIKPEASAPGVNVRSSTGTAGYGTKSGTSMAAPHVVGAIALLKQAYPNRTGAELKLALYNTARDLGVPGEDNDYGMGIIDVYAAYLSLGAPNPPAAFNVYSDYNTPDRMMLSWQDPTSLTNGDTLLAADITILVYRDGSLIDSVAGGVQQFMDSGLSDGQLYEYAVAARVNSLGVEGNLISLSWYAGGAPTPAAAGNFSVAGTEDEVALNWINPSTNEDGTPLDDFAAINLYQNGTMVATFTRTGSDTGISDSEAWVPAVPGVYSWYITAVDNEVPPHESTPSPALDTPLALPFEDLFDVAGPPNPAVWLNANAEVNNRADNPPSGGLALNLNGTPNGGDTLILKPIDLSGLAGFGITLSWQYQPQGTGNAPEAGDSLQLALKNDLGEWITQVAYPGTVLQPFAAGLLELDAAPAGNGSFFHGQFQIRFHSRGGAGSFPNDDWFVDNIQLSNPATGVTDDLTSLPERFDIAANYPNPFNPATTIGYQLPKQSEVLLEVYNVLGQKIRTLLDGKIEAGAHSVVWNGRNDAGEEIASGVYVYRFRAGNFQKTQKMVLLR